MNFQEKEAAVAGMSERFSTSSASFLVHYHGCSCEELKTIRKKLIPSGATFSIVKNTLAKRAISDSDFAALEEFFTGPTAVIWADEDPVSPAKVISDFAKEKEGFVVKAGVVDGTVVRAEGVEELAKLPSKEELFAKLLCLINAPATRLLQTINAPASQVARLLGAWKDELEKKS